MNDRRAIFQTAQQIQQIQHDTKYSGKIISNIPSPPPSEEEITEQPVIEEITLEEVVIEETQKEKKKNKENQNEEL
jgi:hypothetical protein